MGVSGALCVVNAIRAGRFHCMFPGPIFLAGAGRTVLRARSAVDLRWNWIDGGVVAAVAAALVVEAWVG